MIGLGPLRRLLCSSKSRLPGSLLCGLRLLRGLLIGLGPLRRLLCSSKSRLLGGLLCGLRLLRGLLIGLGPLRRLLCSSKSRLPGSLLCGLRLLRGLLIGLGSLRGLLGRLERSLLCGQFRSLQTGELLGGLKRSLTCGFLRCQPRGLLRRKLRCSVLLFCDAPGLGNAQCFGFLTCPQLLLFHGFFNALPGLLARLRTRRRKVAVFGAVQVRPGVERRHVFRRLIWVGKRVALSHFLPLHVTRLPISPMATPNAALAIWKTGNTHSDGGSPHR